METLLFYWTRSPENISQVKALGKSGTNPYPLDKRNALLDKYHVGTITVDEVRDLRGYLEEDLNREREAGNPSATVLLMGTLLGLSAFETVSQTSGAIQARLRQPPSQ